MPKWIYLSPHLDDVVISCGGLVWEQVQAGSPVEIWTICAGDPPVGPFSPFAEELHARWLTDRQAVAIRRKEDQLACLEIGAMWRHFTIPDCIYRTDADGQHLYASGTDLFGDIRTADYQVVEIVHRSLVALLSASDRLVSPMAIGNHVDHQITRAAAEALSRSLWYYADYPYAQERPEEIKRLPAAGWNAEVFPISRDSLQAWVRAVMAHQSQISSFWAGMNELQSELESYRKQMGGVRLWQPPGSNRSND
jgi:LmbE family N-acetylglucosaminyl deacetylase